MVFRKYTLGRYRETITMIKIQTTIKKSERTVLGLRPSSGSYRDARTHLKNVCCPLLYERIDYCQPLEND